MEPMKSEQSRPDLHFCSRVVTQNKLKPMAARQLAFLEVSNGTLQISQLFTLAINNNLFICKTKYSHKVVQEANI